MSQLFDQTLLASRNHKDFIELKRSIALHMFEQIARNSPFFHTMLIRKGLPYFIDQMRSFIMNYIMDSLTDTEKNNLPVPVEILSSHMASSYIGVIQWWLEHDMPETPAFMADQMTLLLTKGPFLMLTEAGMHKDK